jgi:hypothetical protein
MRITKFDHKYAADQAISEDEVLQRSVEEMSQDFVQASAEVYAKA